MSHNYFWHTNLKDWELETYIWEHRNVYHCKDSMKKEMLLCQVKSNINKLTKIQKIITEMLLDGYTTKQIAHIRGTQRATINKSFRQAIQALKKIVNPEIRICRECKEGYPIDTEQKVKSEFCSVLCRERHRRKTKAFINSKRDKKIAEKRDLELEKKHNEQLYKLYESDYIEYQDRKKYK